MSCSIPVLMVVYCSLARCSAEFGAGAPNFVFHKFSNCAEKPTPLNLTIIPRWANASYQLLNGHLSTPIALGDNFLAKSSLDMLVHGKWVHLADASDTLCRVLRDYLGPLRGEVLGSVGLPADTCPIPKGIYHGKNVHLDFQKSRLPAFPYGIFNVTATLYQKSNHAMYLCLGIDFENKSS